MVLSCQTMSKDREAILDYSLTGTTSRRAVEKGLAEADWYTCPVARQTMRKLLERRDGPAIRDTVVWLFLIFGFGYAAYALWGSWWAFIPLMIYGALYASTSDSRWHESSHGTAFRTDWMNNTLYEIASFMVMRESVVWRWSHNRHHSDTIIVGRDPEIAVPRPPDVKGLILGLFNYGGYPRYFKRIVQHSFGRMAADEKTFIPESEYPKVYFRAKIYVVIYASVIGLALYAGSILPLLFVGLTNVYGTWLMLVYGLTQHTGMAENVLDHRLNCRTFRTNFINRFLYWNMNYHVEHHMFPLVPYHALPQLHEAVKDDCPPAYPSLLSCWKEIIPTVLKQVKDPAYYIKRKLPTPKLVQEFSHSLHTTAKVDSEGWVEVCAAQDLGPEDAIRFDYGKKTFALYRDCKGELYATDGVCTHGNTHLADGLVKGKIIECPKHNGRFNFKDGSPARAPVCRGLATYRLVERSRRLWLNVAQAGGVGAQKRKAYRFRVVSNQSVATFIKELVLERIDSDKQVAFTPGDYIQLNIPNYERIDFREFDIPEPFATVWRNQHLFDLSVSNPEGKRRNNYSIASNLALEKSLRFNIRIATPPSGQDCPPGIGSSYVFSLKPGDKVTAMGSFGDFHIKPTKKEMVYIGGGAGMAPLRSHLSYLFETENTARKVSFWYGARSKQEIFYEDYFKGLANEHSNFEFKIALSDPLEEDHWNGSTGFIHEVALEEYLSSHDNKQAVEFYLCGPPMMIKACGRMLADLGVSESQIAFDEF